MKIFSNFDTQLRQKTYQEYQEKYGIDNVICFWRSKIYYMYKFAVPFFFFLLINILWIIFFYDWTGGSYFVYFLIAILIFDMVFFFPLIGKYIDYKMDFIVVIPTSIMLYEQWWILKRDVATIWSLSIKTISIKKSWLLYSMFDNGDLIILTEWDTEHNGEIILRWVPKPEKRRNQIVKIIGMDIQADQNPQI